MSNNIYFIDTRLRVWVKVPDYWEVQFELTEDVKRAFDKADIEIPYPQIDVHNR